MAFPIGNHRQQNTLAAKYAGREAKMAVAKEILTKNLTTVREIATPIMTQVAVNNSPNIPQQHIQRSVNNSTGYAQRATQRAADRCIESNYSYGNENSCVSRTTDWLLRK
ncbi:MAG: hypothetical protein ACH349_02250 [Candidatus Rhabdochlamydia sp.]